MGNAVAYTPADRAAVAREVREYRVAHGLSRAEMAGLLGVSLRTVVALETGTAGLAPRTVRAWGRLRAAWRVTQARGPTTPREMPPRDGPALPEPIHGAPLEISEEEL